MPAVTAWITPQTPIKAWDHLYGGHRQIAGVTFDDVNVHLGGIGDDAGDVGIIAACDKLVAAILDIFPLSNHWWANVDCIGPLGHYSKNLAFETEAEARGCIGLVFKVVC